LTVAATTTVDFATSAVTSAHAEVVTKEEVSTATAVKIDAIDAAAEAVETDVENERATKIKKDAADLEDKQRLEREAADKQT